MTFLSRIRTLCGLDFERPAFDLVSAMPAGKWTSILGRTEILYASDSVAEGVILGYEFTTDESGYSNMLRVPEAHAFIVGDLREKLVTRPENCARNSGQNVPRRSVPASTDPPGRGNDNLPGKSTGGRIGLCTDPHPGPKGRELEKTGEV